MNHAAVSLYAWAVPAAIIIGIILAGLAVFGAAVCWAASRTPARTPPPRPPASPCTSCKPVPQGKCTCAPRKCGHVNCAAEDTSLSTFEAAEWQRLQDMLREGQE